MSYCLYLLLFWYRILLLTRNEQAVAFVGEDVYITSEEDLEAEKYPESGKWHGGVFKCHVGVRGRKLYLAKIQ